MIKRLTTYLLYLILFLLPWQTRWIIQEGIINKGSWEYGTISLYILDLLIILAFVLFIISQKELVISLKKPVHRWLLIIFGLYCLCLIPFGLSPLLSLYKLGIWLVGIILIYLLSKLSFRKAGLAFVSGAMVSGLLGIWQFLSQNSFAFKWLGLASHDAQTLGTSVIEAVAPDGVVERWLRAYGSFDHPNMFGGCMAVALIIASWLWLFRADAKNKFEGGLLIISIAVLTAGTIVSFSRSAWLAAGSGLIIATIYYFCNKNKHSPDLLAWLGAMGVVAFLITSQYSYLLTPRISGDTRLEQISINERLDGLSASKTLWHKKPIFGFGVGTYTLALQEINAKKPSWFYQPVHTACIVLAVEIGSIGLFLVLLTILFFLISIYTSSSGENQWLTWALCIALIILSLFDHWVISLHFGVILSAALLGLLASGKQTVALTE